MTAVLSDGYAWIAGGPATDDNLGPDPHEASLEPCLRELLGSGVFVDVGAHVGRWTVRLSGQANKVIAIEANPETCRVLEQNIELNGLTNVQVVEMVAWDSYESFRLSDPTGRIRGASTRVSPSKSGEVRGFPLDDILAAADEVDLIKLDVEGADLHVLRGLAGTLQRLSPVLFVEDHSIYGLYRQEELFQLLTELGYSWRSAPSYMQAVYWICESV